MKVLDSKSRNSDPSSQQVIYYFLTDGFSRTDLEQVMDLLEMKNKSKTNIIL